MKFLADENFSKTSVRLLREAGVDVAWVAEDAPRTPDTDVLSQAVLADRVLLTFDSDFGELAIRRRRPIGAGIVYFRLPRTLPSRPAELLLELMETHAPFVGTLTTVAERRTRQRRLP